MGNTFEEKIWRLLFFNCSFLEKGGICHATICLSIKTNKCCAFCEKRFECPSRCRHNPDLNSYVEREKSGR